MSRHSHVDDSEAAVAATAVELAAASGVVNVAAAAADMCRLIGCGPDVRHSPRLSCASSPAIVFGTGVETGARLRL